MIDVRFIVCILALVVASYSDLKWRRVSNYLFLFMAACGPFLGAWTTAGMINTAVVCAALLAAYILRMMGGGDVKCIMALQLLYPEKIMFGVIILLLSAIIAVPSALIIKKNIPLMPFITAAFIIAIALIYT